MGAALRFKQTSVPKQQGEQARLKVLQGPDAGAVYVITGARFLIGRGEDTDVMIADLKASRIHAELFLTQKGWVAKDKGSANGILHNSKTVREAVVRSGDMITLGETTFEFLTPEAGTMMLMAPPRDANELKAQNSALAEQQARVRALGSFGGGKITGAQPKAPGAPPTGLVKFIRSPLGIVAALGVGYLILFVDEEPSKPKKKKKQDDALMRDLASYLPPSDPGTNTAIKTFFQEGFREYTHRNWARARAQFETVLQISPGHPMATLYLQNCNKAIEDDVKGHLERAKKSHDAGKLRSARGDYEAVLRLLDRDRTNPSYIEAKDQLDKVVKDLKDGIIGGDQG